MFKVSLGITDFGDQAARDLAEADLTVMDLVTALPQTIEVLIGLDVLHSCKFLLDGRRYSASRRLADDCAAGTAEHWNHEELRHNDAERLRLVQAVKPFLFSLPTASQH